MISDEKMENKQQITRSCETCIHNIGDDNLFCARCCEYSEYESKKMEENKMEKVLVWTNEDAIKMLKSKMDGHTDTSYEWVETVRLAINALEKPTALELLEKQGCKVEPKTESEKKPCEDCVSRQALIEKATSWDKHFADSERCVSLTDIQNAPSVTSKPKIGHWIETEDTMGDTCYKCSHCGMEWYTLDGKPEDNDMNYCAACGCKMIEVE